MSEKHPRRFVEGFRERRERHRERHRVVRVAVGIAGFVIVLVGLALIPLPGPGLLVAAVGLALLALEFAWAERFLERTVERMAQGAEAVQRSTRIPKSVLGMLGIILAVAALAVAYAWDVPLLPV